MLHRHTRLVPALLRYPLLALTLWLTACGGGESGPPQGSYPVQGIAPIIGGAPDLGSGSHTVHFRSAADWAAFWASRTTPGHRALSRWFLLPVGVQSFQALASP